MAVLMADVPHHQRPRERLWGKGPEVLNAREMLALMLGSGTHGASALDLADRLLHRYGSLRRMATARAAELTAIPGIGRAKAARLVVAFRMGLLALEDAEDNELVVLGPDDVHRAVRPLLAAESCERLLVLVCDSRHRVCQVETVSSGGGDITLFPIPEILGCVLRHHGRAFALAHNHPGGDPTASDADREATCRVAAAAEVVGLQFLCHVVVCGDAWQRVPLTVRGGRAPW